MLSLIDAYCCWSPQCHPLTKGASGCPGTSIVPSPFCSQCTRQLSLRALNCFAHSAPPLHHRRNCGPGSYTKHNAPLICCQCVRSSGGKSDVLVCEPPYLKFFATEERIRAMRRLVLADSEAQRKAEPYTSPLSQLNLSSCASVTTQRIPLIHSGVLKLS
jgi:hypothetical protein